MDERVATNFAYTMGIQLQARIEMEGMLAENQQRQRQGESPAYGYDQIMALIEKHGIHHNAILTNMQEGR